jgi:hypothetical protein
MWVDSVFNSVRINWAWYQRSLIDFAARSTSKLGRHKKSSGSGGLHLRRSLELTSRSKLLPQQEGRLSLNQVMYLHPNRGMEEKLTTTQETVGFGWPQFGSPSRRYFTRVPSIFSVRNDLLLALNNKQAHMTFSMSYK